MTSLTMCSVCHCQPRLDYLDITKPTPDLVKAMALLRKEINSRIVQFRMDGE
jgi:hypothetical protein